ncbi:MAG: Tol-Pal system beta propeller repeat protein TolB [Candidatus Macondimonas sp.]
MMRMLKWLHVGLMALLAVTTSAFAEPLRIEVTEGVSRALPVAIVPFAGAAQAPGTPVSAIVNADLARSGRFNTLATAEMPQQPSSLEQMNMPAWRTTGVNYAAIGQVVPQGGGNYMIRVVLVDVPRGQQLAAFQVPATADDMRSAAHRVSDLIYEQLLGERGAFNTRIAYVNVPNRPRIGQPAEYLLMVSDADGENGRTVLKSKEPLMSPVWSPDGRQLAYVSFENGRSQVFSQDLATGKRRLLSSKPGINGAPSWSPDGRQMALALSDGANTHIHLLDLESGGLRQLTQGNAINTEPTWSPDGSKLAFTSDRGGRPQIYELDVATGQVRRLTYQGNYNARPRYSPDGKSIVFIHGGGTFRIAVQDMQTGAFRVLSPGPEDESPSFAPNGAMIIYASQYGDAGVLSTVSFDGKVRQRVAGSGDIREAAWSPYRPR